MTNSKKTTTQGSGKVKKSTVQKSTNTGAHLEPKLLDTHKDIQAPTISAEQIAQLMETVNTGMTRRDVLKAGAIAAGAAALPTGALAMGLGGGKKHGQTSQATELRTYLFDFSWCDTDDHNIVLAAGSNFHKLKRTSPGKLKKLRKAHPVLNHVPDERATHYINLDMPADGVQWCYLQRFHRGAKVKSWDMLMMFIHHPVRALHAARQKEQDLLGNDEHPKVANKWSKLGLTGHDVTRLNDPVGMDTFKDSCDTASTMISGHPEMLCMEANNSAYIQSTITSQHSGQLGDIIAAQGPAEPQQNWIDCSTPFQANASGYATLVPICNPDTGVQATNSNGDLQYMPEYSDTTNNSLNSNGMQPSLETAQQDTTLGANITSTPEGTEGLIWRTQDGVTTSVQDDTTLLEDTLSYTTNDISPGHGYSVEITDVDNNPPEPSLEAVITVEVKNWYVRYLGLFIRYIDSDGNIISPEDIYNEIGSTSTTQYFPYKDLDLDTFNDVCLDVLFPKFEIFGIPTVSETIKTVQIAMPKSATSFLILASGLGSTSQSSSSYDESVPLGKTMTAGLCLGFPFLFLTFQAGSGIAQFTKALDSTQYLRTYLPIIVEGIKDLVISVDFNNPASFKGLGVSIGKALLGGEMEPLMVFVSKYIVKAESEESVLDAIPILGAAYSAIVAIGTAVQIAQTAIQVGKSPSTYAFEVTLTHDIDVTVRPNLTSDPNGWPATATHFDVIAHFDVGTTWKISTPLPSATTTEPVTITFTGVPLGGQVSMSVGVYSDNDYQVGKANAETVDNQKGVAFDIIFKEKLVPLDSSTVYSHKEVIELDSDGNHIWVASTTPPTQEPKGCSPSNGQLCALNGITINTAAGAVGQSFQSYNDAVPPCTNASSIANAHQFSNISTTQDPESEFFFSGCTFSSSPRLVYDLMNLPDNNFYLDLSSTGPNYQGVIRQVRLDINNNPGFDGPDSNLAWGKLQHPSSSMLLHPSGKIISIADTKNKFEVIELPDAAMSDADAPFSHTYSSKGLRPGLMNGPVLAALNPSGAILVIEALNKRIQAFDVNGNSAPIFPNGNYFVPLKDQHVTKYLDFSIEFKGYMFVLSIVNNGSDVFTLDIYTPDGDYLATTTGFDAQRLAVNYWRDIYTQNSQVLTLPSGDLPARTEPSISHWIPSTP